ncbi:MAG TPA: anthranilate phosphoribosyltransferase [Ruminiclostridium sp.]|nr:anthranilate phosphoribosyltransferase [Ruminiclostridium sp.]
MIQQAIAKLVEGTDLTVEEASGAMNEIMSGTATPVQISGYLTALRFKGETVDEITASAKVMREKALAVPGGENAMDIVGTGGDCAFTFNVSTVSSIVAAAAGVKIAKHGNRSVSSKCGAADVLDALGVKLDLTPEQTGEVLKKTGICFMFAQVHHKSMKYAAIPRKELGIRTVFNILGPLSNPAGAGLQILGVYDEKLAEPLARVLSNLGVKRAMVVCGGTDGKSIDEISLCGDTSVCEVNEGRLSKYILNNDSFGLPSCTLSDIAGGDAQENAQIARNILAGEKGPKRNIVLANAAAALYVAGKAKTLKECVKIAAETIDSGSAAKKLDEFVKATNAF